MRTGCAAIYAGANTFEGFVDAGAIERLKQVVDSVDIEGADRILVVCGGENKLGQLPALIVFQFAMAIDDALNDGKAIQARHLYVKEDDVGMVLLDEFDSFDSICALSDDVDVRRGLEQVGEFVAGELFVVDDEGGYGHDLQAEA